ncbi:P-loop containing nucleoside triphosphate hydrolase protein [Mycena capillaripes]|nr:P-loop containing nucleoside triphosphate hydrolase protein [Mycena capillaripes]
MAHPARMEKEGWVDRRSATRTVPMRVLVLGYPRTGTVSMRAALEILGYHDVHHMLSVFANPPETEMWTEAINAHTVRPGRVGPATWSLRDAPAAMFPADLIAAYPDAKVILTNRDPDKWWTSFTQSIVAVTGSWRFRLAAWLDPGFGRVAALSYLIFTVMAGAVITEEGAKARFVKHYDNVRKLVSKARLLEYEVTEGWGPLCAFLGKDVPDTEFPRTDDTQMVHKRFAATTAKIFRRFAQRMIVSCVLLTGVIFAISVGSTGNHR